MNEPSPLLPPSFEAIHFQDKLLQAEALDNFRQHLESRPPMTTALVIAIVAIHLMVGAMDWYLGFGGPFALIAGGRHPVSLVLFGGRVADGVYAGEVWRLLSCVFLHGGAMHLGLNALALFGLGRICEAIYGPARFLWLFLMSGLAGSVLSLLGGVELSVGASGSVFGLMGAGIVYGLRHRARLPKPLRRLFGRGLAPWVVLNLFIGVSVPQIDNLGHLGGLIGGALCAAVFADRVSPARRPPPETRRLAIASGLLLLGTAAMVARSIVVGLEALQAHPPL